MALRISDLGTAPTVEETDLVEIAEVDGESPSGYSSYKTTILGIANKIATSTVFSELQTTSKNVIGAINEISGAASSLVDLDDVNVTTPAAGDCLQYNGTSQKWENKDILAVNETTLTEPYVYKQVPNGKYTEKLKKIVGASIVWNQLASLNSADYSFRNMNFSVSGKVITITPDTSASMVKSMYMPVLKGYKYLVFCPSVQMSTGNDNLQIGIYSDISSSSSYDERIVCGGSTTSIKYIFNVEYDGRYLAFMLGYSYTPSDNATLDKLNIIDLTAMFGITIADYVYSLEQNQAGSGIAWLKSYGFFTEEYYAYSANTIQSVSVSKHITKDSESQTLTETNLDHTTLRGLFKLDANNNLYADGDIYNADGSGSVKYGIVDLGSLNWTSATAVGVNRFQANLSGLKGSGNNNVVCNLICSNYKNGAWNLVTGKTDYDGYIAGLASGNVIAVQDSNYETASDFKTAMSGVKLIYELATPTTATLTPFNPLSVIEEGGTEEFVDYGVSQSTRDVAIPCGNESAYGDNKLMAQIIKYINN